ncbi:MAG: START domain-containing protein [Gammaproteobacteria bacterium]|nr:START domain-containing protein [Gammaproteobacteria bacterium]
MIRLSGVLIIISILSGSISVSAEWKLLKDQDEIQVFSRHVKDSAYDEFKGVAIIAASLASTLGVLDDIAACPEWINYCDSSILLDDNGYDRRHVYQINDLPFPAANRDVVTEILISHEVATRIITIKMTSRPDYYPRSKHVRIIRSDGFFQLVPVAEGRTRVVWQHHAEPGGVLPAFMINSMIVDLPFKSLQAMRLLVQKDKYQQLKIDYDKDGNMVGLLHRTW